MTEIAPRAALVEDVAVACAAPWLTVRFARVHATASWAIVGGGVRRARAVVFHQVRDDELRPPVDAVSLLAARMAARGDGDAIGLMTSRAVETFSDVTVGDGELDARCVATVGLGNALRAGDPAGPSGRIAPRARLGTINLVCRVSAPLSPEALLEALALAAEARTLAVREADIPSVVSGAPASGTGTDCLVIAAPDARAGARYAGKHTALGHVIGASVHAAVAQGVARWLRERGAGS